jgi:hypothetical protein
LVNALSPRENNYKKTTAEMDDFFLSNRREALSRKKAWFSIRNDDEQAGLSLPAHPYAQSGLRFRFDRSRGAEAQGLLMTILDTGGSTGTFGTP